VLRSGGTTSATDETHSKPEVDRPTVSIVTPSTGIAYVESGDGAEVLISLEITDVSGSGIVSDDSGLPRFLDSSHNSNLFRSYVVEKSTYQNAKSQTVIQLVAKIPISRLEKEKRKVVTGTLDWKRLSPAWKERGVSFPPGPLVEFAGFNFRVVDVRGVTSEDEIPEVPSVVVAMATTPYVPAGEPPVEGSAAKAGNNDR
jgi:hypothetical protein